MSTMITTPRSSGSGGPAPLTIDEFLGIVPWNVPPPPVAELLLKNYRALIEAQLPVFTALLQKNATALREKGLLVPERFLPRTGPTREELLRVVAEVYRKMLRERYGS